MNLDIYKKRFRIKLQAFLRYSMVHFLSGKLSLYIVTEYPKSGGTWLGQMVGRALDLPFPRNQFPLFCSSIMHGHYLSPWGIKNVVVIWRDGRDVMVSWYYHCLFKNERANAPLVDIVRKDLSFTDYENIYKNLPTFIDYSFTRQRHPRFSWADFVRRWYGRDKVVYVYYERLRQNTVSELQRVVFELTGKVLKEERAAKIVEEFSFFRQSGRLPGQENIGSFMRKGLVGDWRNHFSREACELFDRYAGNELLLLGYERDRMWVKAHVEKVGGESDANI